MVNDKTSLKHAQQILLNAAVVGLDAETRPAFIKGQKYTVSILQVSTLRETFIFDLLHYHTAGVQSLLQEVCPGIWP